MKICIKIIIINIIKNFNYKLLYDIHNIKPINNNIKTNMNT